MNLYILIYTLLEKFNFSIAIYDNLQFYKFNLILIFLNVCICNFPLNLLNIYPIFSYMHYYPILNIYIISIYKCYLYFINHY